MAVVKFPESTNPNSAPRRASTIADVLDEWLASGPLIHEPTGFVRLDELTGGGPVYGSRWYLNGSPDAGKTAWLVQFAHVCALRGIAVGLLAVDEEAGDILTRLSQRIGYTRSILEARGADTLGRIREELGELPIRFYDGSWTIAGAAADLAAFARERAAADPEGHPHGSRAVLGIDSVQTVTCDAELAIAAAGGRPMPTTEAVTARVQEIRAMATRHRMITVATSELGRSAYAKADPDERTSNMAGAKWSGAVEYSARVLLGVRSVNGEPDVLELEVTKNKHGPRDEIVHLRIDRQSQTLVEIHRNPEDMEARTAAAADEKDRVRVLADAAQVAATIAESPGKPSREIAPSVRARAPKVSRDRTTTGLARLGAAVVYVDGPRNARYLHLDGSRVPPEVLAVMSPSDRALVEASKPPSRGGDS